MEIAKNVTGKSVNHAAKELFENKLKSSVYKFNKEPIPKNESKKKAGKICTDIKSAKQYCRKRWAAVQKWMAESRKVGF